MTDRILTGFQSRVQSLTALFLCISGLGAGAHGQQGPPAVSPQPFNLPAYIEEIDQWTVSLERLKEHPEDVPGLREQLPQSWPVKVGAQRVEVPTRWLRAGLNAIDKDPKGSVASVNSLLTHLRNMQREAEELADAPQFTAVSAREKLNEILSRREFAAIRGPTWFSRQLARLNEWLADLFERLSTRLSGHPKVVNVLFWVLMICGAGSLLVWLVRRLLQRPGPQNLNLSASDSGTEHSWQQLASEARKAAADGQYRDAIRLAYWAAIHRLEELGLWSVDHTRTHREYLRLVHLDQPQREPLAALTRQFELAWYAVRSSSQAEFQSAITQMEKLGCVSPSEPTIDRS